MERKQLLNHKPRVEQSVRSKVKYREVTKQDTMYSPTWSAPIYHPPKQHKYPERHFLDPSQRVVLNLRSIFLTLLKIDFLKNQFDKEIKTNSSYQEEAAEQEYKSITE